MREDARWLLPEGIDELLPDQAWRMELLRRELLDLCRTWGYELIMTPFVEFLESLLTGTGKDLDLQTFKLTDQLSGRMLGVRADITPQAARIDAHRMRRQAPNRLCYMGSVLRTRPEGLGGARSPLQFGAELFGHAGLDSDVEVVSLMLAALGRTGVGDLYLDIGHVGVFRGLAAQAGLAPAQESALFEALQRKSTPEVGALARDFAMSAELADMFVALPELNGGDEVLAQARERLRSATGDVLAAIDYVDGLARRLADCQPGLPVHFDLAELRGYGFHSGAVFAAFVPGRGQEIARGGRYDHIGEVFGAKRPATGFSADLRTLLRLMPDSAGDVSSAGAVYAPAEDDAALRAAIESLRGEGRTVVQELPGQTGDAADLGCAHRLVNRGGDWVVATV